VSQGTIVTFYSYKGGVGRTMALANLGVLLSRWGYRTLMVDWDLEAPGLEYFFRDFVDVDAVAQQRGVIDYLYELSEAGEGASRSEAWRDYVVSIPVPGASIPPHMLTAGQRSAPDYFSKVQDFDLTAFYERRQGGKLIEALRDQVKQAYDLVLVDSRTGFTDIGGVCTIQLPDILVLVFTATIQGFEGAVRVARKAATARKTLPANRFTLLTVPVPSRFDPKEEYRIAQEWLDRFAKGLTDIYKDWLPRTVDTRAFLERTKIPYSAYFSFGEKLPVLEQSMSDPTSLGFAYENLGALLALGLADVDMLVTERDHYVARARAKDMVAENVPRDVALEPERALATPTATRSPEPNVTGVLEAHREWIASAGAKGKVADLSRATLVSWDLKGENLSGAILSGANLTGVSLAGAILTKATLSGANLVRSDLTGARLNGALMQGADLSEVSAVGADFSGANLQGSSLQYANLTRANLVDAILRDANLHGAKLQHTDLRRADLSTAQNLNEQHVAGANLADVKVPESLREFENLSEARGVALALARLHSVLFLAFVYVVAAVAGIDDRELLGVAELRLPIFGLKLSPVLFFVLVPTLLLASHVAVSLIALQLAQLAARLPAIFPDGRRADQRIPSPGGLYLASITHRRDHSASPPLVLGYFSFLVWWIVPLVLLFCAFAYLPRQDGRGLTLLIALLAVGVAVAVIVPTVLRRIVDASEVPVAITQTDTAAGRLWTQLRVLPRASLAALVIVAAGTLALAVLSWSGALWRSPSPYVVADVSAQDISTKLVGWQPGDTIALQGAQLGGRSLRGLRAGGAFAVKASLPRADLTSAQLNGADLTAADLRRAVLNVASLSRAVLFSARLDSADLMFIQADSADFRSATLGGASLNYAYLNGSIFEGADLRGSVLASSHLTNAVLTTAVLQNADLRSARLSGARLSEADLRGADLSGVQGWREIADLRLANLYGAVGLTPEMRAWAVDSGGAVEAETDSAWSRIRQPAASVVVAPELLSLMVGATSLLTARILDINGNPLPPRNTTWTVTDSTIASVSPSGLVRGLRPGRTTVRVTVEDVSQTVSVTVGRPITTTGDTSASASTPSSRVAAALVVELMQEDGEALGNGVAFGTAGSLVYIVVPAQLVPESDRMQQSQQATRPLAIRFQGTSLPIAARALARSDPALNIAVVSAPLPSTLVRALGSGGVGVAALEPKMAVYVAQIQSREPSLTPGLVSDVDERFFRLDTRTSRMPQAGSAIVSAKGDLVGMVTSQRGRFVQAVRMDRVLEALARFEYPISLQRR
jgi:uncharacterized protein YjbI with pentapeptide repeats/cellulose biosynthesis protein BcsQ